MLTDDFISKLREFVINNSEKDDIHGYPHIERVYNTCMFIGKELGADLMTLTVSSLLHDIGRIDEELDNKNRNHAELSAEKAFKFLNSQNFEIANEKIEKIIHCIKTHSFSNKIAPATLEAKILSDADKLDAIGAIGVYRTIGFTIKNNGGIENIIEHLENKILKLRDLLYLDISKKIAKKRHKLVQLFYNEIKNEITLRFKEFLQRIYFL